MTLMRGRGLLAGRGRRKLAGGPGARDGVGNASVGGLGRAVRESAVAGRERGEAVSAEVGWGAGLE